MNVSGSINASPARTATARYRPDIDGLRAVAVVSVVLFHTGVPFVTGGYAGVDVFFVISGYLITGGIERDLQLGRFSILGFYERRVRRIYPALLAAIAATFLAGLIIFMPDELRDLGSQIVATVAFCSNILFWMQTDYFAGPAEYKALLHTWSLAVEEQFYLVIPALMAVIHRRSPGGKIPVLAALAAVSFLLSCAWAFIDPSGNYYLPHTRAWELLAGSLVALGAVPRISARHAEAVAAAALIMLVAPFLLLDSGSSFPAWNALPTCLGTALLIHVGEHHRTLAARLLGTRPMVAIGLISYSLYLVHWPIIVFAKYQLMRDPTAGEAALLIVLMIAAACLCWRFVEQPFRRRRTRRTRLFAMAGAGSALLAVIGAASFATGGFPQRLGAQAAAAVKDRAQEQTGHCFLKEGWQRWSGDRCYLTRGDGPVILLWGDSHANQYAPALRRQADRYRSNILLYASAGCPPLIGITIPKRPDCRANNDHVLEIIKAEHVSRVVLSSYWQRIFDDNGLTADDLAPTLRLLEKAGVDVKVIGDNPDFPFANPTYLGVRMARRTDPAAPFYTAVRNDFSFNDRLARAVGADRFYDPLPRLCRDKACLAYENGSLLMTDNAHLSTYGAERVLKDLDSFFR